VSVSTHVLDAAAGRPAAGILVTLSDGAGDVIATATTDTDGRAALLPGAMRPGTYRLRFDVGEYSRDGFFPEVTVAFRIRDSDARHHVPLLLSPHAYTTYRGS
jgi:5-hydroxyisourate hydrolase